MTNIGMSNNTVSEISATILYQLLHNIPQDYSNHVLSSSSIKEEYQLVTNQSATVSPDISVGIEESTITESNQISGNILSNNDLSNFSSTSSSSDINFLSKYCNLTAVESVKLNPKKRLLQRHLLENGCEENKIISDKESDATYLCSPSYDAPFGRGKNGKPLTRTPFIPSYMDPKSGPFLCRVCGYKASGLHYRVMACEGCKGFFRRSVQKKLTYTCKMNNNCKINSDNRTKCQKCRWKLCIDAGMHIESVLNENERQIKNNLIRSNRQKRKEENPDICVTPSSSGSLETGKKNKSDDEIRIILETIDSVTKAFDEAFIKDQGTLESISIRRDLQAGQDITRRVTAFAKLIPGINELSYEDQNTLLQKRCLDIICLCTALTFNSETQHLKLPSGKLINAAFVEKCKHLEPLWNFARRTSEYNLTKSEMAILTALVLLVNNSLSSMDSVYNQLLAALDHLMSGQPLRNSKLLIVVFSDLQVLTSRLFELRAPLGHQLLFDNEPIVIKEETSIIIPKDQNYSRINRISDCNKSSDDRSRNSAAPNVSCLPVATSTNSSIYAFSYGDQQL